MPFQLTGMQWLCALFFAGLWFAPVATAEEFYKGRSINFIIGSAPGGGYDTYSRLVASHLGRYIEGRPTIIPQNMPGAGSIVPPNYLYNVAPKDGTAIGMLDEAIYLNQILGLQEPAPEAGRSDWVGGACCTSCCEVASRRPMPPNTFSIGPHSRQQRYPVREA